MEQFIVKVQGQNRIAIPELVAETLKIKKGTKVRISIEVVR